jgi:tripartite-type tricarboxylate transporter receptor subunit TctC
MKIARRHFLSLAAGAACVPLVGAAAFAETYPSRPIRFVVPFPPGGVSDIIARFVGQSLAERLGQPFVVEDRGGAGSNIGTEIVVNAPSDGHTILLDGSANAVNASLYPKLGFVYLRDIAPVASIFRAPHVMEVAPGFPAETVAEFIAYAKAHPRQINMASAGVGTISHMAGELFAMMTGIALTHVVAGYEASNVNGIGVPAKTAPEIVNRLNEAINAVLAEPATQARFAELGGGSMIGSPAAYAAFLRAETDKWAKVVKAAGLKPA